MKTPTIRLRRIWPATALLLAALSGCEVVSGPPPGQSGAAPAPPPATAAPAPQDLPGPGPMLARALESRAIRDDDAAGADLSALLQLYPEAAEARAARYYLAESFARRGRWTSAAELFRQVAAGPADDLGQRSVFWLARCAEAAGDWAGAVALYQQYRALATPLEPYAAMRQAAQEQALGRLEEAAASYEAAAAADIVRSERAGSYEKAIAIRRELGQGEAALGLYDRLLELAEQPAYRARLLGEAAALADQLGRADAARAYRLTAVAEGAATGQTVAAVERLLAAGDGAVAPATAARILFAAEGYAAAVPLFDAAIPAAAGEEAAELRRLRGLAIRAQGDFAGALAALAEAGAAAPDTPAGRQAQLDWIQTLGQSGDSERASGAYGEYAAAYPDDPRAPEALARAAILRERLGDAEGAARLRLDLGRRYPQSAQAAEALHAVGLGLFSAGRYGEAREAWRLLDAQAEPYERARGAFWAGRSAAAAGDREGARAHYSAAAQAAPDSYYGARAADELGGRPEGSLPLGAPIPEDEWAALVAWVAGWAPAAADEPADMRAAVAEGGAVRRAEALAAVGLPAEARAEWVGARELWRADPRRLVGLAAAAHQRDVAYAALGAARLIAAAAPPAAPPQPAALRRLLFPTPYPALVAAQSGEHGVDPRLLYALMRQESLFDPDATSWVGARGLAQVMPETGAGIAQNLGVADFSTDQLYRPVVSVRFGAFYLGTRIRDMNGSVQAALAAYNGGLGNAMRWAGGDTVADPDAFAETIDFPETENYVKLVYGYYSAYRSIYGPP